MPGTPAAEPGKVQMGNVRREEIQMLQSNAMRYMASVVMFVVFNSLLVYTASAAPLFEDDFNDGDAVGWNVVHGTWSVINNHYVSLSEAGGDVIDDSPRTTTGELSWSSYTYNARMKLVITEDAWNDFGLIFYAQDPTNYLRFTLGSENTTNARLSHFSNGGGQELGTFHNQPVMFEDTWYNISLVLDGSRLSAYVDGVLVVTEDSLPYDHGYIGITSDDPTAYFDDIVVIPEPATLMLLSIGGLAMLRRRNA